MKNFLVLLFTSILIASYCCKSGEETGNAVETEFEFVADRFADIQVLRYQVPGFEQLTLQQKELAYYLYEAGLSGRDIFYDQKYKHGLLLRKTIEGILNSFSGERKTPEWNQFEEYCNQVFLCEWNSSPLLFC